ncbi:VOC family protein [candidate division KSB1 bacterium]|nr:VOC family protein [candidate division KSB1 bacterium]
MVLIYPLAIKDELYPEFAPLIVYKGSVNLHLHHIGIVVRSIDERLDYYRENFGIKPVLAKILDPLQDVYVAFLQNDGSTVSLELVEPASPSSPAAQAMQRGGGLNHLCYAVHSIEQAIAEMLKRGAIIVKPTTPAVAFNGRRIAFLYTKAHELIELVEEEA